MAQICIQRTGLFSGSHLKGCVKQLQRPEPWTGVKCQRCLGGRFQHPSSPKAHYVREIRNRTKLQEAQTQGKCSKRGTCGCAGTTRTQSSKDIIAMIAVKSTVILTSLGKSEIKIMQGEVQVQAMPNIKIGSLGHVTQDSGCSSTNIVLSPHRNYHQRNLNLFIYSREEKEFKG